MRTQLFSGRKLTNIVWVHLTRFPAGRLRWGRCGCCAICCVLLFVVVFFSAFMRLRVFSFPLRALPHHSALVHHGVCQCRPHEGEYQQPAHHLICEESMCALHENSSTSLLTWCNLCIISPTLLSHSFVRIPGQPRSQALSSHGREMKEPGNELIPGLPDSPNPRWRL